jgi:AcrR family transcriptional regulator
VPIDVDETQRLREIAAATVRVAEESGARSVTIRAVAKELGGSTAMITNYLPSRDALMFNAFRVHDQLWQDDLEQHLSGLTGIPRLRALVEWHCTSTGNDDVLRRLWIEMLSTVQTLPTGLTASAHKQAHDAYSAIADAMADAGLTDAVAADMLFLIIRGYFVATIEDPSSWPPERAAAAALTALDLLLTAR